MASRDRSRQDNNNEPVDADDLGNSHHAPHQGPTKTETVRDARRAPEGNFLWRQSGVRLNQMLNYSTNERQQREEDVRDSRRLSEELCNQIRSKLHFRESMPDQSRRRSAPVPDQFRPQQSQNAHRAVSSSMGPPPIPRGDSYAPASAGSVPHDARHQTASGPQIGHSDPRQPTRDIYSEGVAISSRAPTTATPAGQLLEALPKRPGGSTLDIGGPASQGGHHGDFVPHICNIRQGHHIARHRGEYFLLKCGCRISVPAPPLVVPWYKKHFQTFHNLDLSKGDVVKNCGRHIEDADESWFRSFELARLLELDYGVEEAKDRIEQMYGPNMKEIPDHLIIVGLDISISLKNRMAVGK